MSKRKIGCEYSTRLKKLKKTKRDLYNQRENYDSSETDEWEIFSHSSQSLSKNSSDESDSSNELEDSTESGSFEISSEIEYEISEGADSSDIDSVGNFLERSVCESNSVESFNESEIEFEAGSNCDGKMKNYRIK